MNDSLGDRMKEQYETRTRFFLPRRTYTVVRIDGKAFHSYTRGFQRPFDDTLSNAMDITAIVLAKEIQGACIGFVQSDEISIVLTDFDCCQTEAWFNGNLQKISSVASSTATMAFNAEAHKVGFAPTATFDARAFTIPDREEVMNYLVWRQQDASRNSVQMVAQSLYSHKELHAKNNAQLQEMIFQKGTNWDSYPPRHKRGSAIIKVGEFASCDPNPEAVELAYRQHWIADSNTPIFTQDRDYLDTQIPSHGY